MAAKPETAEQERDRLRKELANERADCAVAIEVAQKAAATISAIYQWVDQVNEVGGVFNIAGVAKANAMLKSLNGQRSRLDRLIMEPLHATLAKLGASK